MTPGPAPCFLHIDHISVPIQILPSFVEVSFNPDSQPDIHQYFVLIVPLSNLLALGLTASSSWKTLT